MNDVLRDMLGKFVIACIDDLDLLLPMKHTSIMFARFYRCSYSTNFMLKRRNVNFTRPRFHFSTM